MATRGFVGRRPDNATRDRLPPGQHLVEEFPVLTAGATPRVSTDTWSFSLRHGIRPVQNWTWLAFQQLPMTKTTTAFSEHTQPGEEIIYVLEGSLEYQMEGKPPMQPT